MVDKTLWCKPIYQDKYCYKMLIFNIWIFKDWEIKKNIEMVY